MARHIWLSFSVIIAFSALIICVNECDARGGRGRGGGSFGGIFGGWRKYKKPASGSSSRRIVSSSPMQTAATKPIGSSSSLNSMKQTKTQASYPKQEMSAGAGYHGYGGGYGNYYGGAGAAHMPPGSAYYPNTAAMPPGAIYYTQTPARSGTGDFLFGMMAGHMVSNMLFRPHPYVTHVYQQNPEQSKQQNGAQIIVINNGTATVLNMTETASVPASPENTFWPTDTDVPLEPFNASVTPADAMQPGKIPIFERIKLNNSTNVSSTPQAAQSATPPPTPPANGIICMPIMLNETDPNDPTKVQQVERTICFPAPPPPPPASTTGGNCVMRTFIETDPNDPSKTIEVPKEICTTTTTTIEPPQVAGEIGENISSEMEKETTLMISEEVNEQEATVEEATATSV